MKEIDKIRIRQWNQDNPYIQMKNLENAQPGYRVHTVNDDHHLYELPLETQNISLTGYSGISIRHKRSTHILPVMI